MSRTQIIILWVIAIILAGSAVFVKTHSQKASQSNTARHSGDTLFANFPGKDIARIQIIEGKETVGLARKDGKWVVADRADYPANTTVINEFIRQLAEVKVVEGVEADPSFAPRFGMDPNSEKKEERGVEVVFSNEAGTEIARVTLGKNLTSGDEDPGMMGMGGGSVGRFVRNNADTTGVYKVKELFSSISASPSTWLDQQFLSVENVKDISVSKPGKTDTDWKLTRPATDGEFTLEGKQDSETLDPSSTGPLKNILSSASFEDVIPVDRVVAMRNAPLQRNVEIVTTEGFDYKLTIAPVNAGSDKSGSDPSASDGSFLLTVDVNATIPAERKKEANETADDAKGKDAAFVERKKVLEERLAAQKAIAGRVFKVSSWTVEALMKDRDSLLKKPVDPSVPQGADALNSIPGLSQHLPQQGGGLPSQLPPRRPVQAVTPPVAVPPLETPPPAPKPEPAPAPAPEPAKPEPAPAPEPKPETPPAKEEPQEKPQAEPAPAPAPAPAEQPAPAPSEGQ